MKLLYRLLMLLALTGPALAENAYDPVIAKAKAGDAASQFLLGTMYLNGEGVEKNTAEAFQWLKRSAEQNHIKAQFQLGLLYGRGDGVERNYAESWFWLAVVNSKNPDPRLREILDGLEDHLFASEKLDARLKLDAWNKAHPPSASPPSTPTPPPGADSEKP